MVEAVTIVDSATACLVCCFVATFKAQAFVRLLPSCSGKTCFLSARYLLAALSLGKTYLFADGLEIELYVMLGVLDARQKKVEI